MKDYAEGCGIFVERWKGVFEVERWKGEMVEGAPPETSPPSYIL